MKFRILETYPQTGAVRLIEIPERVEDLCITSMSKQPQKEDP